MGNQSTLSPSRLHEFAIIEKKSCEVLLSLHYTPLSPPTFVTFILEKKISRKEGVSIVRACNKPHLIDDRLCKLVLASRRLLSKSLAQNISLLLLIVVVFFFGVAITKESQQKFTITTQYLIYFADELEAKKS